MTTTMSPALGRKSRLHLFILLCFACVVFPTIMIKFKLSSTSTTEPLPLDVAGGGCFTPNVSDSCSEPRFALVYVHTSPDHFAHRNVIRSTWGHPRVASLLNASVVFMVGKSADLSVQRAVEFEGSTFNDIVHLSVVDTYKNLTRKSIESIRWIRESCGQADFVVKSDDDMVINMFGLVKLLRRSPDGDSKFICCRWVGMQIERDNGSKWYVSEEEMSGQEYPPYCSGSTYIFPGRLLERLYNATLTTPFFWVDDVYTTGLLANRSGAGFVPMNDLYNFVADVGHGEAMADEKILFAHVMGELDHVVRTMYGLWERVWKKNELDPCFFFRGW